MPWREIKADEFEGLLLRQLQEDTETARLVALETAQRGLYRAVKGTNSAGAVDRGQFKRSWMAVRTPDGAELRNDAPYAAVIEYGRRPGKPGPPLLPILAWVSRKFGSQLRSDFKAARKEGRALAFAHLDRFGTSTAKTRARVRRQFAMSRMGGFRPGASLPAGVEGPREKTRSVGVVGGAMFVIARAIRDKIHAKGTKPRFILRKVVATMGDDFQQAAVRVLRRKHGNG